MACGTSGSKYDLSGNKITDTYGRLVQAIPEGTEVNQDRLLTPVLYDGYGNPINGVKFQEAFERDEDGNLVPTEGPFFDWFWEQDENGNKQPRDIKFWLDDQFNITALPEDKGDLDPEPYTGNVKDSTYDFKRVQVTEDYTVSLDDHLIGVDTTSGSIVLTLPSASLGNQSFIIKDEGYFLNQKRVTLVSVDAEDRFENNETELILSTNGTSVTVYSNGNDKYFIV